MRGGLASKTYFRLKNRVVLVLKEYHELTRPSSKSQGPEASLHISAYSVPDSVRPLEKRGEGKGSQKNVINMAAPRGAARRWQVAPRQNQLFADKYDSKSTFEFFGDCASVLHRS
ncbi:hypothetical protein BS47DRAFT_1353207, partial [Hydnum rufescens UP504]